MHLGLRALGWSTLLAAFVASRGSAAAPNNEAAEFYSRGVRAYFSGDSAQAELYLSLAMEFRPDDPRVYYFRALALEHQGRTNEARGDIVIGAALEAASPQRYAVGQALERIQGAARLQFERARQEARRDAVAEPSTIQVARHESDSFTDERFLRRPVTVSLEEFLPATGPWLEADESYPVEPPPHMPSREAKPLAAETRSGGAPVGESSSSAIDNPFVDDPAEVAESDIDFGTETSDTAPTGDEEDLDFGVEDTAVEAPPVETSTDPETDEGGFGTGDDDPFGEF